jgi:hypothetical protein
MRVGETIATFDVGLALRGKSGKFEVTSPAGEIYDVTCRPNHSFSNLGWSSDETDHPPFLIRKVAERVSPVETTAATSEIHEEESQAASSPRPFVLEHAVDEGLSLPAGKIELYLEDDPETEQPSARLCLKSEPQDNAIEIEMFMTSRCGTFNELDSEIRGLQAQLDEIRLRAKKMFYKAHVVAASA